MHTRDGGQYLCMKRPFFVARTRHGQDAPNSPLELEPIMFVASKHGSKMEMLPMLASPWHPTAAQKKSDPVWKSRRNADIDIFISLYMSL